MFKNDEIQVIDDCFLYDDDRHRFTIPLEYDYIQTWNGKKAQSLNKEANGMSVVKLGCACGAEKERKVS